MKQCPYCHSEIEDNARFCLYCMKELDHKTPVAVPESGTAFRRALPFAAVGILLLGLLIGFFLFRGQATPLSGDAGSSVGSVTETESKSSDTVTGFEDTTSIPSSDTASVPNTPTGTVTSKEPVRSAAPKPAASSQTPAVSTVSKATVPSEPLPEHPVVTYTYRDAKPGDDFAYYANIENAVVITGVKTVSPNGVYYVPATIDGKRVIAIGSLAFSDASVRNTVKQVIVADGVRTIQVHAFEVCVNMTDIWLCGKSIYTDLLAFCESSDRNGTLTIHCSADCEDRNFHLYKNAAENWHAVFKEWNG